MYPTYQALYDNGKVTFLKPVHFKKAKIMITIIDEGDTCDYKLSPFPEDELTPTLKEKIAAAKKLPDSAFINI